MVCLKLFNTLDKEVAPVTEGNQSAGTHRYRFDGREEIRGHCRSRVSLLKKMYFSIVRGNR